MISRLLLPVLGIVVLSSGLLHAQQAPATTYRSLSEAREASRASRAAKIHAMYEDIEIFRRILDRKLQPLYPRNTQENMGWYSFGGYTFPPGGGGYSMGGIAGMQGGIVGMQGGMAGMFGMAGMPNTITHYVQEVGHPLEGVYLFGRGVVYTATLSSLRSPPAKAETPRPVSEWESVRRQLHNEKESPKPAEASKPPELRDVLLKVLAENGHHFAQLGENESLTLVITVRGSNQSAASANPAKKEAKPPADGGSDSATVSKVRDLELLGDLHMKQEHYGMARDAFRQAVELKPGREQTAALARKLAQAYLMLGKTEEARWALDQAIRIMKDNADTKDKPASAVKLPAVALPVKLIISAPKKLLDEVTGGKISFEEFRRRASVETLTFDDHRR